METKKYTNDTESVNYYHVEPNSHFYTDINQLIKTIEIAKDVQKNDGFIIPVVDYDYILIGLKNTLSNGYNINQITAQKKVLNDLVEPKKEDVEEIPLVDEETPFLKQEKLIESAVENLNLAYKDLSDWLKNDEINLMYVTHYVDDIIKSVLKIGKIIRKIR